MGHSAPVARRPTSPAELREAVERTVQATLGSAERQRERTQGAIDDLAGTVDQLRKGAEAGIARGRHVIEERRPATSEDVRDLKAEIRRLARRLDAIEERLPAKRSAEGGGAKRSATGGAAKRSAGGGAAKRSAGGGGAKRSASGAGAKRSAGGGGAKRSASGGAKRSASGSAAKRSSGGRRSS